MTLRELKATIEGIDIGYDYDAAYRDMYNAVVDYSNETQDFSMDYIIDGDERIIDYDFAEELAKHELESGGLVRLWYFMGDCNFNDDLYYLNAYGNLEPVTKDTLENFKYDILQAIEDQLEDEDDLDDEDEL